MKTDSIKYVVGRICFIVGCTSMAILPGSLFGQICVDGTGVSNDRCFSAIRDAIIVTFELATDTEDDVIYIRAQDQNLNTIFDANPIRIKNDVGDPWTELEEGFPKNVGSNPRNISLTVSADIATITINERITGGGVTDERWFLYITGLSADKFVDGEIEDNGGNKFVSVDPVTPRLPVELVFCLDGSGSMRSADKWESLKSAVGLFMGWYQKFHQQGIHGFKDDKVGYVVFRCDGATTATDLTACGGDLESGALTALAVTGLPGLLDADVVPADPFYPQDYTPIWKGVYESSTFFGATSAVQKIILVSDGKQNRGIEKSDALLAPAKDYTTYSIGLGTDAYVKPDEIRDWALDDTGGDYRITDDPIVLRAFFAEILGSVLGLERLTVEDDGTHFVQVESGAHKVVLAIDWEATGNKVFDFDLTFIRDDGGGATTTFSFIGNTTVGGFDVFYSEPGTGTLSTDDNAFYVIESAGSNINGRWEFGTPSESSGTGIITLTNRLAFVNPGVNSQFWFERKTHGTGQPIRFFADLRENARPITGAQVEVEINRPMEGVGELLSQTPRPRSIPKMYTDSLSLRIQHLDLAFRDRGGLDSANDRLILFDDGAHGDGEENDGKYSNEYVPTEFEGSYRFRFLAKGITPSNSQFTRTKNIAERVRVEVTPDNTTIDVVAADSPTPGFRHARVIVEPRDKFGRRLGPYNSKSIQFSAKGARLFGSVIDNLDGSYSQILEYPKGQIPIVTIDVQDKVIGSVEVIARGPFDFNGSLVAGIITFDPGLNFKDALLFGPRFGVKLKGPLGIQGDFLFGQTQNRLNSFSDFFISSIGLRLDIMLTNRIKPFISAGGAYWKLDNLGVDLDQFGVYGSFGLTYKIRQNIAFNLEAKDYLFRKKDRGDGLFKNFAYLFSLSIGL